MPLTKLNSLAIPPDTIVESDLSYPLTNFSSTGIDDNATSTAITITSDGKVGINESIPTARHHVQETATTGTNLQLGRWECNSSNLYVRVADASDTNSDWELFLGGSEGLRFSPGASEKMRITSSGNVGIGATTPDSELDVRGIVLAGAGSPSTGQIAFGVQYGGSTNIPNTFGTMKSSAATCIGWGVYGNPSVNEGFVSSVDTSLNFRRGALLVDQDELRFLNAGQQIVARDAAVTMTERMKVDASGRLMLNIAASSIQAPLRAQAFGTTSSYFGYYFDASGTVLSYVRGDGLFSTGTGSLSPYSFSTTGRDVYVNSSGQLGYVSSIREAKENIQPLEDVSWLYSLSPVSFNYKEKDDEGRFTREVNEEVEYGLIADEVEQANANLCFYDENEEGDKTLAGVSYRKLIPALTKAIQEQQAMIEALQAEVTALKEAP